MGCDSSLIVSDTGVPVPVVDGDSAACVDGEELADAVVFRGRDGETWAAAAAHDKSGRVVEGLRAP